MKIQVPDDDVRLQRLNQPSEQRGAEARPVEQTEAVKPSRKVDDQANAKRQPADRRQGRDRRQKQDPVLLDTRSGRERRGGPRRAQEREQSIRDAAEHGLVTARGIDTKA